MDYLEENVEERLRAVAYKHREDVGMEYIRSDVAQQYKEERGGMVEELLTGDLSADRLEDIFTLNDIEYLVQKFDEAVIVIIYTEDGGIMVSMDSDIDVMPSHFVQECLTRVEGDE